MGPALLTNRSGWSAHLLFNRRLVLWLKQVRNHYKHAIEVLWADRTGDLTRRDS